MLNYKLRLILSSILIMTSCVLITFLLIIKDDNNMTNQTIEQKQKNINTSIKNIEDNSKKDENKETKEEESKEEKKEEEVITVQPTEKVIVNEEIAFDGKTLNQIAEQLDSSFKNELSGKGYLYASYSLEKGVDPYLAAAISLEETGCNYNCSNLVKSCNNVGGMKGSGCNSYGRWPTLDDGIRAFIDNIARNYVAYGLTTADTMNPKYAENPMWARNVNNYIGRIKNS